MADTGDDVVAGIREDLAKWRERLAAIPDGSGFDQQRSMLNAWIKEGQRLVDRLD